LSACTVCFTPVSTNVPSFDSSEKTTERLILVRMSSIHRVSDFS
jgi:hypothetical protein